MSALNNSALIGASGSTGYQISRSVRLRSSASAYLTRTPASAGNRQTWTWSGWVKRGSLAASNQILFSSDNGTSNTTWLEFGFDSNHAFYVTSYTADVVSTTAVFRDPSAWYHIVVQFDSTQATSANRCRIYFNGVQQAVTGAGFTLNASYGVNAAQAHDIGRRNWPSGVGLYTDGYLTEINFIDGQALTPSSFGETNTVTGVWQPKKYAGTYGTNGFYLNFSDNSAATAAAIGKDYSGNGNNWTPNNISLTAGVTYDSMIDTPTPYADGGNGRGNYCVLSPLDYATAAPTNGNLTLTNGFARATMAIPSTGKWYWENTIGSSSNNACGLSPASSSVSDANGGSGFYAYYISGTKYTAGSSSAYGASYTSGDVIGVAVDSDAGTVTFYKNNVSQGVAFSGLSFASPWLPLARPITSATTDINFGQRPFAYTPPTGFKALNTLNLPEPTILKGNQYFDATTYTGNGSSLSVTNSGAMQPDLVWTKARSTTYNHSLVDSVRGVSKSLQSNLTNAEDNAPGSYVTAFNSDGFTVGTGTASNANGTTYVGWQWKEGATQGFDIVTYTGNGAARTISHNLGVAPSMMIVKSRGSVTDWRVYHALLNGGVNPANYTLKLNTTNAQAADSTIWNNTAPTSSVFSLGANVEINANAGTFVAYLFAPIAGYSAFGSYTGNGSTDGPMVFTGFLPRWIMIKRTDTTANWGIADTARSPINAGDQWLFSNLSDAEYAGTLGANIDILSNGFKLRIAGGAGFNTNGGTYVYACFASNPFKNALAR